MFTATLTYFKRSSAARTAKSDVCNTLALNSRKLVLHTEKTEKSRYVMQMSTLTKDNIPDPNHELMQQAFTPLMVPSYGAP